VIEQDDHVLWLRAHADNEPPGLRLGSTRVDADWVAHNVDPRALFER
jgi:hypothetical protein